MFVFRSVLEGVGVDRWYALLASSLFELVNSFGLLPVGSGGTRREDQLRRVLDVAHETGSDLNRDRHEWASRLEIFGRLRAACSLVKLVDESAAVGSSDGLFHRRDACAPHLPGLVVRHLEVA